MILIQFLHHGWRKFWNCGTSKCSKMTWFCFYSFTMAEENFENVALRNTLKLYDLAAISHQGWRNFENVTLRNALKLHDIFSIPSPWFKKNLGCGTSKCYETTWFCCNSFTLFEVNFENAALRNALKLQDFDPIPSPWLKKILNTV